MMMHPDDGVTIVITNRNQELLLPRAVRAGLRALVELQAVGIPGLVLVVDDGSRDGSQVLLSRLEARYYGEGLRVAAFASGGGETSARNRVLACARHRHIVITDAEHELVPENLPTFVTALRQTGAAGAYGTVLVRTPTAPAAHAAVSHESIQGRLFADNYLDGCAAFDRTQLAELGGYVGGPWEAREMWLRLAAAGRTILFVPIILGYRYLLPSAGHTSTHAGLPPDPTKQTFDSLDTRRAMPLNTRHRRYHPEMGYF